MGVTPTHPLFIAGTGWGEAGALVPGDAIRDKDLQPLTVLAVEVDPKPQMVHNLEIADAHTYFAGELAAWGHNAKRSFLGGLSSHFTKHGAKCGVNSKQEYLDQALSNIANGNKYSLSGGRSASVSKMGSGLLLTISRRGCPITHFKTDAGYLENIGITLGRGF